MLLSMLYECLFSLVEFKGEDDSRDKKEMYWNRQNITLIYTI